MDMLINLIVTIISQCILISNHPVVLLNIYNFVNYTSIKLEKIKIINALNIQDL